MRMEFCQLRVGEALQIGEGIALRIVGIESDEIVVEIDAPSQMPIHRGELLESLRRNTVSTI